MTVTAATATSMARVGAAEAAETAHAAMPDVTIGGKVVAVNRTAIGVVVVTAATPRNVAVGMATCVVASVTGATPRRVWVVLGPCVVVTMAA